MVDLDKTIDEIIALIEDMCFFWKNSQGWAPKEVSEEFDNLEMDRFSDFTKNLHKFKKEELSEGELVLVYTIIGSILEGVMIIFYTMWLESYNTDIKDEEYRQISKLDEGETYDYKYRKWERKENNYKKPSELGLELLKVFSVERLFSNNDDRSIKFWKKYITIIQENRNSIHVMKKRRIDNSETLNEKLELLVELIKLVDSKLIYPDGYYHGMQNLNSLFE
ncbi:MAG: hypothetical protein PHU94_01845 [Bacilli bacterium]|nr:hypothetical protein [Bacilli bacterium]MDD4734273.1 hypothetical protein [Bacilli bacterium]